MHQLKTLSGKDTQISTETTYSFACFEPLQNLKGESNCCRTAKLVLLSYVGSKSFYKLFTFYLVNLEVRYENYIYLVTTNLVKTI